MIKLAGGSLRSPPTRNTAKYCIYIIISSDCHASGSLALLGSLSALESDLQSVQNAFSRAAGAPGARSENFFQESFFFCQDIQIILMHQVSKQSFLGRLCSERNAFSRAAGAPGVRSGIFFHGSISFVKTVPTRYHMSMGSVGKCVLLPRQAGRETDRENRHYQNIYIDDNFRRGGH